MKEKKFYLGKNKEGKKEYLIAPKWSCSWYWGFGYVETFADRDIETHQHFNSLFLEKNIFNSFKDYFIETPLTDDKIWQLLGYMKEFYIMESYVELLQYGNYITVKAKNITEEKNKEDNLKEVERINKKIMIDLFDKIEKLF